MTAIEWLLNEFQEAHKDFGGLDLEWLKRFNQAKEMEKQQIIDALIIDPYELEFDDEEQYYNETYGK
jgi:hypothetical protein